jgi:DNA uptake protein ComE-like DNA-binding protein
MLNSSLHITQWISVSLLAALIFLLLLTRFHRRQLTLQEVSPLPVVVEVQGDSAILGAEKRGTYLLEGPKATVFQALEAAGICPADSLARLPDSVSRWELHTGDSLRVSCQGSENIHVRIESMDPAARLTLGKKLDLNRAKEEELYLVPRMRSEFARAIVDRREQAPWKTLQELEEISGVGPKTIEKWKNYLEVLDKRGEQESSKE